MKVPFRGTVLLAYPLTKRRGSSTRLHGLTHKVGSSTRPRLRRGDDGRRSQPPPALCPVKLHGNPNPSVNVVFVVQVVGDKDNDNVNNHGQLFALLGYGFFM